MTQLKLTTLLCLAWVATAALADSDYYVWVDEDGVTNYSERSPRGIDAEHVTDSSTFGSLDRTPGSRRPGATPLPAMEQPVDPDELAAEQRAAFEQEIAATKRQNCEIGKRNLAQLQAYARIRVKGDDGEERFLSDEEKQTQIEEARQIIRDNCKR